MNITPLIIPESVVKSFDYFASLSGPETWRIKWRGKFLTLGSGKSSWATRGRARAAFLCHCKWADIAYSLALINGHPPERCHWKADTNPIIAWMIDQLEQSGDIEFVKT